jgi:hypothetical protein
VKSSTIITVAQSTGDHTTAPEGSQDQETSIETTVALVEETAGLVESSSTPTEAASTELTISATTEILSMRSAEKAMLTNASSAATFPQQLHATLIEPQTTGEFKIKTKVLKNYL